MEIAGSRSSSAAPTGRQRQAQDLGRLGCDRRDVERIHVKFHVQHICVARGSSLAPSTSSIICKSRVSARSGSVMSAATTLAHLHTCVSQIQQQVYLLTARLQSRRVVSCTCSETARGSEEALPACKQLAVLLHRSLAPARVSSLVQRSALQWTELRHD